MNLRRTASVLSAVLNQAFPWLCLALGNGGSAVNGTPIVISLCDSGNPAELWSLG